MSSAKLVGKPWTPWPLEAFRSPQSALEFWKKEHRQEKAEKGSSKKRPMDDDEALSEKKLQEIAKEEEAKKRQEQFKGHFERFRHPTKE